MDADKYSYCFCRDGYYELFESLFPHFKDILTDERFFKENISFFTKLQLKTLYPLSFKDCVNNVSKRFKINKFMIYSVMKAESLFKHYAVSKSGAIGLMQIMPATGGGLERQLKLKKYNLNRHS